MKREELITVAREAIKKSFGDKPEHGALHEALASVMADFALPSAEGLEEAKRTIAAIRNCQQLKCGQCEVIANKGLADIDRILKGEK